MLIRKKFTLTLSLVLAALGLTFLSLLYFTIVPAIGEMESIYDLFQCSRIPPCIPIWLKFVIFLATAGCFIWAFINLCTFRPRVLLPMLKATRFCEEMGIGRYPAPLTIHAQQNAEMNALLKSLNIIRDRLISNANRLRSSHSREVEARRTSENNAELKSMLISRLVPEVRIPLNNVAGFAELLDTGKAMQDTPEKEYIEGIRRAVSLMTRYLERLQKVGAIGKSGIGLTIRNFRTEDLLLQLKEQNKFPLSEQSIKLQTPYLPEMPEYLRTDQEHLLQLLGLMVRGVARASGAGETLQCLCIRTADGVEFHVSDTAKAACREEIAELYNHICKDSALSGIGDAGTAVLGMIFIEAQAALFGGKLTATKSACANNEFILSFSAADIATDVPRESRTQTFHITDTPSRISSPALAEDEYDGREYSVLVGEDDPDNALILKHLLEQNHFHVCTAAGADEVMNCCKNGKFDAMILSQSLPCGDLLQFIRQLLRCTDDPHYPIMVLASGDEMLSRKSLNKAGARCILLKPLNFPLMVRQLRGICRRD